MPAPNYPIFSPSDTEKWLECPRLLRLGKEWQPRVEVWQPWRDLGSAIHAGLAQRYQPVNGATPLETALDYWTRVSIDSDEWTQESLHALTTKGLTKALEVDLLQGGQVVGAELRPAGYHAILDLLATNLGDGLTITDHKVKRKGERSKLDYIERDYDPAWATWHYAWVVWKEYGKIPTIQYNLIFLEPRPWAHLFVPATQPTEAGLGVWEANARLIWQRMENERSRQIGAGMLPPMNPKSCHNYGRRCDFYEFCWSGLNGQSHTIDVLYQRKGE